MSIPKTLVFILFFNVFVTSTFSQDTLSYAEKLGWKKTDKVVILHVDDVGMSFDSNEGAIEAMTKGIANSCSVMMPCPWVPAFVHYLKQNPKLDAGLHLTLTSEWKNYRWGPLSGKPTVPGLVDEEGALWNNVPDVVKHATADEVEKEITAQIERARKMGFEPTHLDSHMGTLFATPAFTERYIKVGIENKIPVMFPAGHATLIASQMKLPDLQLRQMKSIGNRLWKAGLPVLDDLHNMSYAWVLPKETGKSEEKLRELKTKKYIESLQLLRPGITMVIMHCTLPSEVFKHISDSGPTRKGDLLAMMDPQLKNFIQKSGIILTTWRELNERRSRVVE